LQSNSAAKLGDLELPLLGVLRSLHGDVLLVLDVDLDAVQRDSLLVGDPYERDNRSIGEAHLQEGEGIRPLALAGELNRFVANHNDVGAGHRRVALHVALPGCLHCHVALPLEVA
jgi:hypothetical protein